MIKQDRFIEYAKYSGNWYGRSKENIDKYVGLGKDVVLDSGWDAIPFMKAAENKYSSILILPPSRHELINRLLQRNMDNVDIISKRLAILGSEINHYKEYDYIVINKNLSEVINHVLSIILVNKLICRNQEVKYQQLIQELMGKT